MTNRFAILCAALLALCSAASAAPSPKAAALRSADCAACPVFTSAASARGWGESQERAGRFELASQAFLQEAALRTKLGDTEGAEVERRRAWRAATTIVAGIPIVHDGAGDGLAKLEPASGCLIGALDTPSEGRTFSGESVAADFERRIGKPVAVAFRYIRYGQPFPFAWARDNARRGRAVELAMEPYNIYDVAGDEYLEGFAADLNQSGVSCFLRFGGEMNGGWAPWGKDPEAYRRAFRTVHDVMAHFAPRCAMVWAPNMMPQDNLDRYYPGDDAVDWVGLSLYMVKYYDDKVAEPGWQDHPAVYIDPFYQKYAARKPVCLVECGVTRQSHADGGKTCDDYAAARIEDLLAAIKLRYPRLKMLCWFDRNNLGGLQMDRRLNDYSLPPGTGALAAFAGAVADPYFLSRLPIPAAATPGYQVVSGHLPADYAGRLSVSVATYALHPTVDISCGGHVVSLSRPFEYDVAQGSGPLTITVRDENGHPAKTLALAASSPAELAAAR